ncbi:MAG: hypothetical protein ACRD2I_17020 [Vicinamibacterales bacterium]
MATSKKGEPESELSEDIHARIESLKAQVRALNGGDDVTSGFSSDCPLESQERFWKQVIAFETAPEVKPLEILERSGLTFPPDGELDAAALTTRLSELIGGLADLGVYLLFTDHLSDRELYALLVNDILREPMALDPEDSSSVWHIDLTGRGSEAPHIQYLKYYADEEARRSWADEWPDDPIPDIQPPPFDRDRRLPSSGL